MVLSGAIRKLPGENWLGGVRQAVTFGDESLAHHHRSNTVRSEEDLPTQGECFFQYALRNTRLPPNDLEGLAQMQDS